MQQCENDRPYLARFLKSSKEYSSQKPGAVKEGAFLPEFNSHLQRYERSVFQIGKTPHQDYELSELQIKALADLYITPALGEGRRVHGYARLSEDCYSKATTECRQQNFTITLDFNNDPPRHAAIIGWPDDKSQQKVIAQTLARHSSLQIIE